MEKRTQIDKRVGRVSTEIKRVGEKCG